MNKRNATVVEVTYRKRRKGILYRKLFITYDDGSGETFLVPTEKRGYHAVI